MTISSARDPLPNEGGLFPASTNYQVSKQNRIARVFLRPIFRGLFHILAEVRISGKENVPRTGGYLVAMNHVSTFDPPFVVAFWPKVPEVIGAIDIWSRPGQSTLIRMYGGIPVHRGSYDRKLIEKMIAVLNSGRPLVIAPEGGRSHAPGLRRGLPGVAYAMNQTHVPVVPVGIVGTTDDFFTRATHGDRPTLKMNIGKPITLPPIAESGEARRLARQRNADLIMREIANLLPGEYQGVYAISNQ
ncbi:MAG: phospholipid/glycerol acyltransferase [Chloroflexi bacterium]|jgi:1-acyl-sn-glycerol-3-phosphate acyltransferase|nr:phospholipid/glycerol acyltransferase [Chloroflexota bacterium]